ncbi:MAG TPA: DUF4404 family protein [Lacipirellulaceae bacterium]|jgi:hypothetical protein
MEQRELVELLARLQAELSRSDQVDPATLESLRALTGDVTRLLEKSGSKTVASPEVRPAARGLRDLLLEFEAGHPQLSDTLGKVADALAAMGI